MGVLNHGGVVASQLPVSTLAPLYHPASPAKNPASDLLLRFEQRTVLGALPSRVNLPVSAPRSLLSACAQVMDPLALSGFWGDLNGHASKHLTSDELPYLNAAAAAVRAEIRARRIDPDGIPGFFPVVVNDLPSYAALARALLYLAVLPRSPLRCRLYCPRNAAYAPPTGLTLNIDVPLAFLAGHGQLAERASVLGLTLASAETVVLHGGTLLLPMLGQEIYFSTLFAPQSSLQAQLHQTGHSAALYLQ